MMFKKTNSTSPLLISLTAAVGGVAGMAGALAISWYSGVDSPAEPSEISEDRVVERSLNSSEYEKLRNEIRRLRKANSLSNEGPPSEELSQRIRDLEEKLPRDSQLPEPPSAEEVRASHDKLVSDHQADPIDTEWASSTTRLITSAFDEYGPKLEFRSLETECRMSSCVSVIEWPSKDDALSKHSNLIRVPFQHGCARQLILDEDAQANGTHRASFHFDCTEWRANGSPEFPPLAPLLADG